MTRSTGPIQEFAKHLVAHEAAGQRSSGKSPAAFQACEKLRVHLTALVGSTGLRALLMRALALASMDVTWLREVQIGANGSLAVANVLEAPADPQRVAEGEAALVERLLELLVAFIGEGMTLQIVHQVWPRMPVKDVELGTGERYEKA